MAKNLVAIALEWLKLHTSLKELKLLEAEKRAELVNACFPAGLAHGVNTAELSRGYVVKATVKPAPKMPDRAKLEAAIAALAKLGSAGNLLAGRLFKWTPELSLTEWKKLDDKHRALFKDAVEIGSSGPSVELIEPN